MRVEGKPELLVELEVRLYVERDMARHVGQCS